MIPLGKERDTDTYWGRGALKLIQPVITEAESANNAVDISVSVNRFKRRQGQTDAQYVYAAS